MTEGRRPLTNDEIRAAHEGEINPLHGRVHIVACDPRWVDRFEREAARVSGVLTDRRR